MFLKYKMIPASKLKRRSVGFIALTSVIIIGAVAILIIVGIFSISRRDMERGLSREFSEKAFSLASLCAEEALYALKENSDYLGNETFFIGNDFCDILLVEGDWETGKTIKTRGVMSDYKRRIKIDISTTTPEIIITDWQEVVEF